MVDGVQNKVMRVLGKPENNFRFLSLSLSQVRTRHVMSLAPAPSLSHMRPVCACRPDAKCVCV